MHQGLQGVGLQLRVGKAPAAHGEGELPSPDEI